MPVDSSSLHRNLHRSPTQVALAQALTALPLVAFFVYATWLNPISPFYADYDPEFQYMLNSLEVFKGSPYAYVDHPGTPLEVLGSAIYASTYPLLGRDPAGFIRYHLKNPALFLNIAHGFLALACIACVWFFIGLVCSTGPRANVLLASALAAMYFAIHPLSFSSLTLWSHNSFSFPFGTLFLLILFKRLHGITPGNELPTRHLIGLGLGAGILATVTIYLLSWVVTAIVVIMLLYRFNGSSVRRALGAGITIALSSLAGFLFMVLPVLNRIPTFLVGISQLLAYENSDPLSPGTKPFATRLTAGFDSLYPQAPTLFVIVGLLVVLGVIAFALEHKTIRERPELWAMALGLALQVALLAFFILQRPVTIYLLSIAATAPVLALVILKLFEPRPALARALRGTLTLIILAGYLGSFAQSLVAQRSKAARITQIVQQTDDSLKSFAQSTGRPPADLFALWSYRSYSPCFALWFANDSTGRAFRREIGDTCYRQYQFNVWARKVVSSQGVRALADAKWDVIIGCEDGFATGGLEALPHVDTFPSLKLECGSLKIAYNRP